MKLMRSTAILLMASVVALAGCQKDGANPGGGGGGGGNAGGTGGPNGGPVLSGSVMVMGSLDGTSFQYVSNGSSVIALGTIFPFNPYTYMGGVLDTGSGDTYLFYFGNINSPSSPPSTAQFSAFFAPGTRPLADVQMGLEQGVELEYVDADLVNWRTSCGSGDQAGSSFTITAVQSISGGQVPVMRIVGTFTAKFYRCDGAGMKQVTNGKFRLDIPNG
jgi:hypothetical protein